MHGLILNGNLPGVNPFGAKLRKSGANIPARGRPGASKMDLVISRAIRFLPLALLVAFAMPVRGQVIEYEANGQKYQTLTRKGLTVIMTHLRNDVAGFGLIQVSVANGSGIYWVIKPEEFAYVKAGVPLNALPAGQVVDMLLDKGSHSDVVKLVTAYENNLYAIPNMRTTNGYEMRRRGSMTMGVSAKLEAAAAASAIALAQIRIAPGQSTDGAIFIPLNKELKSLTGGKLVLKAEGETFEFNTD